jgi:hypothetical protein
VNDKIYQRAVKKAKQLKPHVSIGKSHHITVAIKKSRIICVGVNNYKKLHNTKKFGEYANLKGFETPYQPCLHSEISLIIKLGEEDLSDYELLNIRLGNEDSPVMSKSCDNCAKVLQDLQPKRVFYSDEQGKCQQDNRFS